MLENLRDEYCPRCQSLTIEFNQDHGFYKCLSCGEVWAHDDDDPDYDEMILPDKYTEGFPYPEIRLGRNAPDGN